MDKLQQNNSLSILLDVMTAMPTTSNPQILTQRMLDQLHAHEIIVAGGVWLFPQGQGALLSQVGFRHPEYTLLTKLLAESLPSFADFPHQRGFRDGQPFLLFPLASEQGAIGALVVVASESLPQHIDMVFRALQAHLSLTLIHMLPDQNDPQAQVDRVWDEFLLHAAHELKNPLASIKGYADLLLRRASKNPTDSMRKGLTIISQQVVRTTALIDLFSDVSRIGTNRLLMSYHPGDLVSLIRQAIHEQHDLTPQHQIIWEEANAALIGRFDSKRMLQVLDAMLSNAIKFSPDGGQIHVHTACAQVAAHPEVTLSVHDYGIGIPADEQAHVFERFFRASNVRGTFSGLGISLFVARTIAELHGGKMWIESAPEVGTTCFLMVPLR